MKVISLMEGDVGYRIPGNKYLGFICHEWAFPLPCPCGSGKRLDNSSCVIKQRSVGLSSVYRYRGIAKRLVIINSPPTHCRYIGTPPVWMGGYRQA